MTLRKLPPLNAVRVFEAAARHLSLTQAATELSVTQGAVSRQIKILEDHLGVRLFERHSRGLSLSAQGIEYLEPLREALNQIEWATARVRNERVDAVLTVNILPTLAVQWFVPRFSRFMMRYPETDLRLITSIAALDPVRDEFDVAIRIGNLEGIDATAARPGIEVEVATDIKALKFEYLLPDVLVAVCTPALRRAGPPLAGFEDLRAHTLLHLTSRSRAWQDWFRAAGRDWVEPAQSFHYGHFFLVLQAALAGCGVALVPKILAPRISPKARSSRPSPSRPRAPAVTISSAEPANGARRRYGISANGFAKKPARRGRKPGSRRAEPCSLASRVVAIVGDAKAAIRALAQEAGAALHGERRLGAHDLERLRREWNRELAALSASDARPIKPRRALRDLAGALPEDTIVVSDIGNVIGVAGAYLKFRQPRRHIAALGYGGCGAGLGLALGAKFARPELPVVALIGDGSWSFSMPDLVTAVQQDLPVTVVLLDNSQWGAEKRNQVEFYGNRFVGTNLQNPDFAAIARLMGAEAVRVDDPSAVGDAVRQAVGSGRTSMVHLILDPRELGEAYRRDALRAPQRILPRYAATTSA